jgi:hypothetical protein
MQSGCPAIVEAPDDLRIGHRFDHRDLAVAWAESMRADMERWAFDLPVDD